MNAVLIVNDWDSYCSRCGKGADPGELAHDTMLAGFSSRDRMPGADNMVPLSPARSRAGCGARFIAVSSDYSNIAEQVQTPGVHIIDCGVGKEPRVRFPYSYWSGA